MTATSSFPDPATARRSDLFLDLMLWADSAMPQALQALLDGNAAFQIRVLARLFRERQRTDERWFWGLVGHLEQIGPQLRQLAPHLKTVVAAAPGKTLDDLVYWFQYIDDGSGRWQRLPAQEPPASATVAVPVATVARIIRPVELMLFAKGAA